MNAEEANKLHLPSIIEAAGGKRDDAKSRGGDEWYSSPFRSDTEASLKATVGRTGRWMWTDYGAPHPDPSKSFLGGNVLAFANVVLRKHPDDRSISEALKWLRGLSLFQTTAPPPRSRPIERAPRATPAAPAFRITKRQPLKQRRNFQYIEGRGVDKATAARYLEEITFQDDTRQRVYYGLGMRNEADGWEITTATEQPFKACVGAKSYTLIETPEEGPAHVFEGMFDFLSFLTLYGIEEQRGRVYILHSVAMAGRVAEHLKKTASGRPVLLWLDNDEAGRKAADTIFAELADSGGDVGTMNHLYDGFKDLNDWLRATPPAQRRPSSVEPKAFYDTAWNQIRPSG